MKKPVSIGRFHFDSIDALTSCARRILNESPPLAPLKGDDLELVQELRWARTTKRRLAPKDAPIHVGFNDRGNKTFVFTATCDGLDRTFSYTKAAREAAGSLSPGREAIDHYKNAMRMALGLDIETFKLDAYAGAECIACASCGEDVPWCSSHVDHEYPITFDLLLWEFTRKAKLRISGAQIEKVEFLGWELSDPDVEREWREYHTKYARLRVVCASCNLSLPKTDRRDWAEVV